MANIIIFFIILLSFFDNLCFVGSFDNLCPGSLGPFDNMIRPGSLSPFDNIHPGLLDPFDINPTWFAWFLLLIYDSLVPLVPLIIYGSLVPLIISWFSFL